MHHDGGDEDEGPLDRITWSLHSPFPKVRATCEHTYADVGRGGSRVPAVRQGGFSSRRYSPEKKIRTLTLGSNDYLIFSHGDKPKGHKEGGVDNGGKVLVSYPHMVLFQDGLAEVAQLVGPQCFVRQQGESTFRLSPDESLTRIHVIQDLYLGSSLSFGPTIIPAEGEAESDDPAGVPAVRMFVNGLDYYSDATLEAFMAFERYYQNFDLAAYARQAMPIAAANGALSGPSATEWGVSAPQPSRRPR